MGGLVHLTTQRRHCVTMLAVSMSEMQAHSAVPDRPRPQAMAAACQVAPVLLTSAARQQPWPSAHPASPAQVGLQAARAVPCRAARRPRTGRAEGCPGNRPCQAEEASAHACTSCACRSTRQSVLHTHCSIAVLLCVCRSQQAHPRARHHARRRHARPHAARRSPHHAIWGQSSARREAKGRRPHGWGPLPRRGPPKGWRAAAVGRHYAVAAGGTSRKVLRLMLHRRPVNRAWGAWERRQRPRPVPAEGVPRLLWRRAHGASAAAAAHALRPSPDQNRYVISHTIECRTLDTYIWSSKHATWHGSDVYTVSPHQGLEHDVACCDYMHSHCRGHDVTAGCQCRQRTPGC